MISTTALAVIFSLFVLAIFGVYGILSLMIAAPLMIITQLLITLYRGITDYKREK